MDRRVKLLKKYGWHPAGAVVTYPQNIAELLVGRDAAEYLDEGDVECAAVEAPQNAMKGKPRKRKARTKATGPRKSK